MKEVEVELKTKYIRRRNNYERQKKVVGEEEEVRKGKKGTEDPGRASEAVVGRRGKELRGRQKRTFLCALNAVLL